MKITVIHPGVFPDHFANRVHVINTCFSFSKSNETELISYYFDSPKTTEEITHYYGVTPTFKITQIRIKNIKIIRGLQLLISFPLKALRLARKSDLIFTRSPIVAFFCTLKGKSCILELHTPIQNLLPRGYRWLNKLHFFSNPFLKKLVVITQPIIDDMAHAKIPKEKCLVYPDAVNTSLFKPKQKESNFNSPLTLMYCGSFYKGKGLEQVLQLAEQDPENNYVIYGGKPHEVAQKKIDTKHLSNIEFRGFLAYKDVPNALHEADILLAPFQASITLSKDKTTDIGQYTSPLKLFEYMATGIPIICSDTPVIREVMTHKENCLLVSPTQIEEWKNAIQLLQENAALRDTISKNSLQLVNTRYNWDTRCNAILKSLN
jgi:glycosyltransferase involved in cell wall biosynthesis